MEIINQDLKKMKLNNLRYTGMVLLLLPLLFFASCKKNDNPEQLNKASQTLFQYIDANKNLSLYQAALKRAGMYNAETFSKDGPFTVFAPVDSAFTTVGLTLDSINRYDPQALASVLKYAMVYGKISNSSLVGFYAQDVSCLNPIYNPNLTKNYYGIFFNGIPLVANSSVDLNDGVVHQVTRVPFPPVDNVLSILNKMKNMNLLVTAIKKIGFETKYGSALPPNQGYFTFFAATDDAFNKFGYPDVASIEKADPNVLRNLFGNFSKDGGPRLFTSGFRGGYDLSSSFLYVAIDGFTLISTGNLLPIHIIRPDILASNGIIHVVDQVISPVVIQ